MLIENLVASQGFVNFSSKLEKMGSAVLAVGLIMHFLVKTQNSNSLLTVGFSSLAIVYFFRAFIKINSDRKIISLVFNKIYGYSLSISLMSVLFILNKWPISNYSLLFSLILLLIATFLSIKIRIDEKSITLEKLHFIRLLIAISFVIYAFLVR